MADVYLFASLLMWIYQFNLQSTDNPDNFELLTSHSLSLGEAISIELIRFFLNGTNRVLHQWIPALFLEWDTV